MKNQPNRIKTTGTLRKVRNKVHIDETYFTYTHWPSKTIDGVEFISVVKFMPSQNLTQEVHYMRKDNLEFIK